MADTNLSLEKFSQDFADLQTIVEGAKAVTLPDLEDKEQLELVKKRRMALRNLRVRIKEVGKDMREGAVAFQKAVIAKEKEYIAVIEPEEERLSGLEEAAKKHADMEKRRTILPQRLERLVAIGDDVSYSEEDILAMDGPEFEGYCNKRLADKNEKDRQDLERRAGEIRLAEEKQERERKEAALKKIDERKIALVNLGFRPSVRSDTPAYALDDLIVSVHDIEKDDDSTFEGRMSGLRVEVGRRAEVKKEEDQKKRAQELQEAEERGKEEARKRLEKEAEEKIEREAREKAEEDDRLAQEKDYQDFLTEHDYSPMNAHEFYIEKLDGGKVVNLFKLVGSLNRYGR